MSSSASAAVAQVAELTLSRNDLATRLDATVSEHRKKVNELHSKAEQAASRWSKEKEEMVSQLNKQKEQQESSVSAALREKDQCMSALQVIGSALNWAVIPPSGWLVALFSEEPKNSILSPITH